MNFILIDNTILANILIHQAKCSKCHNMPVETGAIIDRTREGTLTPWVSEQCEACNKQKQEMLNFS